MFRQSQPIKKEVNYPRNKRRAAKNVSQVDQAIVKDK